MISLMMSRQQRLISRMKILRLEKLTSPELVRQSGMQPRQYSQTFIRMSMPPSLIVRQGMCGRKSFPTKKHRKTKSSITLSISQPKGTLARLNMRCRNSLTNLRFKNWKETLMASALCFSLTRTSSSIDSAILQSVKQCPRLPQAVHHFSMAWMTISRMMQKRGSWVARPSMMRSASAPQMQWCWLGSQEAEALYCRMKSMILCSPSPGQLASEKTTVRFFQRRCVTRRSLMQLRMAWPTPSRKGVPGVMTLESKLTFLTQFSIYSTSRSFRLQVQRSSSFLPCISRPSMAARNLRVRCWFILALGATPSMARQSSLRGRTMFIILSTQSQMFWHCSWKLLGTLMFYSLGLQAGWMSPFMSTQKLSMQGLAESKDSGAASAASFRILGLRMHIHLKKTGTPIQQSGLLQRQPQEASLHLGWYIIMKRSAQKGFVEREIKIPKEFLRKLDKISLQEFRETELLARREMPQTGRPQLGQLQKSATALSLQSKRRDSVFTLKSKDYDSTAREKSSSVRFRTTGAGFRQRVMSKPSEEKKIIVLRRSPVKTKPLPKEEEEQHYEYKEFLVERETYDKRWKKEQPQGSRKRIYFGEKFHYRERAEFQYSEKFAQEDLEWGDEISSYRSIGFGVDNNLSQYDLPSLDDPTGSLFLNNYKKRLGKCPIYKDRKYQWLEVQIVDFDVMTKQVVVHRLPFDDIKKVSRLSIMFEELERTGEYWRRINEAKKLRRVVKEEEKYVRYVQGRKEMFELDQLVKGNSFQGRFKAMIEREWLTTYSRQIIIYKEMVLKPEKFEEMGIKNREFKPFHQPPIVASFAGYENSRQQLANKHYSRFQKFPSTLWKLFQRLRTEQCTAIITNLSTTSLQKLTELQCQAIKQAVTTVHTRTRELLLSDILGVLAFSFKNKVQERRYYKLHNFIFKDLIVSNLYHCNIDTWLNFLSSFVKWTNKTPQPIVYVNLYVNVAAKVIEIEPSEETARGCLLKPLVQLEKGIENIPDIMSEVMGGEPVRLKILHSLIPKSRKVIQEVCEYSYQPIRKYCSTLQSKLVYLQRRKYEKQMFTNEGLKVYRSWFQRMSDDWHEVTHAVIGRTGMIEVEAGQLKNQLIQAINKQKARLGKFIQKQIEQQVENKREEFKKREQELKKIPQDYLQVLSMRRYLNNDCQTFIDQAILHHELTQHCYNLLEDFSHLYSQPNFQKVTEIVFIHNDFMKKILKKLNQLNDIEQAMIEEINQERDAILKGLQEMHAKIDIIRAYTLESGLSQSYIFTNRQYLVLEGYQKQLDDINYREKLLGQEISIFPLLTRLEKDLRPFYDLWNIYYHLLNYIETMKTDPVCTINYEQLNEKFGEYYKDLNRLIGYFMANKNPGAFNICESLLQKVSTAQSKMWIIKSFTTEGMIKKEGIRKEVLVQIFKDKDIKFQEMTLDMLLEEKVEEHQAFVISTAEKADRIWKLQQKITGIVNQIKKLQFVFETKFNIPIVDEKLLLSLTCAVQEQIEVMMVIKDLEEASYIQKKINTISGKLEMIEGTLEHMMTFQVGFFPVYQLTRIDEISSEMPKEMGTLTEVQRIWKAMCNHFIKDCQIWQAIDSDSHRNRLQNMFKLMGQVDKKLNQVLDLKRQEFPRLFFISREEFKYLLMNDEKLTSSRFMPFLFSGIREFIMNEDKIRGVVGHMGEEIHFKRNLPKKVPWEYLRYVAEEVGKINAWEINFASNKNQRYAFSKGIKMLCEWTGFIEEAIANRELEKLLGKLMNQIQSQGSAKNSEEHYLLAFLVYFRDKIKYLQAENVTEISNFTWRKQIKYYKTQGGGVEMKTLNLSLPFQQEYTGHAVRPLFLMSDRIGLQMILCCWTMNNGIIFENVNHQTMQEMSEFTMRHFVNFNLGKETNEATIVELLKGYHLAESWTCFTIDSLLTKQIFSIIVQTVFEVYSAIEMGRTLFYVGADNFNLSKTFRFNLAISRSWHNNPNNISDYRIRSYKFDLVFRSISWLAPSQSKIVRFRLQSLGLKQEIIHKLLHCYQFYLLKLKNEWYHHDYIKIVNSFSQKYLSFEAKEAVDILELFGRIWSSQLSDGSLKMLAGLLGEGKEKVNDEGSVLKEMISTVQQGKDRGKYRIMVVGKCFSGKTTLVLNIFKEMGIEINQSYRYIQGDPQQWQFIDKPFYSKLIPHQQRFILKMNENSSIQPTDVSHFLIYCHKSELNWKQMAFFLMKTLKISENFKKQLIRQLYLIFQFDYFHKAENYIRLAFISSLIKILNSFANRYKLMTMGLQQTNDFVFMLIYWQTVAFVPTLSIQPLHFGASLEKDSASYYYDLEKMAWLEWVTIQDIPFSLNASLLSQIYIPLKQTVALQYLLKIVGTSSHTWIESQSSGIGLRKLLQRAIKQGTLQTQKLHKDSGCWSISKILQYSTKIFKQDGIYYPKLKELLTVCVEDVHLSSKVELEDYLSTFCKYNYELKLGRQMGNTSLVLTSRHASQSPVFLASAKAIVRLGLLEPCQQSRVSLFNYYLDWFFSNTDNPFSKQVRSASEMLVQLSLFLTSKINTTQKEVNNLTYIVRVFDGVTHCSPRTVKTVQDILQIWLFEWNSVFQDDKFKQGRQNYDGQIDKFMETHTNLQNKLIMQILQDAVNDKKSIYLRMPALKVEYSETYRKVDRQMVHEKLVKMVGDLDLSSFTALKFIVYPEFLDFLVRIMRIFGMSGRHVLIYGARASGKKALLRIASFICWNKDAASVVYQSKWQNRAIEGVKDLVKLKEGKCLIFGIKNVEDEQFISIAEELVFLGHPRAFLYDQTLSYLEQIGMSSSQSKPYIDFKANIRTYLHCCLLSDAPTLTILNEIYPSLTRRLETINLMQTYPHRGHLQISQFSIGLFYTPLAHISQITALLASSSLCLTKAEHIRLMQLITYYYELYTADIEREEGAIGDAIAKIRQSERHKEELDEELVVLVGRLDKITQKVIRLKDEYKQDEEEYLNKVKDFNEHNEQCAIEKGKTNVIRLEVEHELNKVFPMLKAAEEAMAKVTRDDINQLRSFPNPPVPAVKVVESLVFLFNQSSLVKQKVLESGQKVRDFWQYAKKFILNDRLLKRVEQFKPEVIKNLQASIISTLKDIIKKPEFIEERVFKASGAAGNLSLWIKAIVAVYDVMKIMQPKKKLLNEAEEALRIRQEKLNAELGIVNETHGRLKEKKKYLDGKIEERQAVEDSIERLEGQIAAGNQLLGLLHQKEADWEQIRGKELKEMKRSSKVEAIFMAVQLFILSELSPDKQSQILAQMAKILNVKDFGYQNLISALPLRRYPINFLNLSQKSNPTCPLLPLTHNFTISLMSLHERLSLNQRLLLISDPTHLLSSYLCSPDVQSTFDYSVQRLNCLQIKDLTVIMEKEKEERQLEEERQEKEEKEQRLRREKTTNIRRILVLQNLQHRDDMLEMSALIWQHYADRQIICVFTQQTQECRNMLTRQHLPIHIRMHPDTNILPFYLRSIFALPNPEPHLLSTLMQQWEMRQNLLSVLINEKNIITNAQALQKWMNLYRSDQKRRIQPAKQKKIAKMQEESIMESVTKLNQSGKIQILEGLRLVDEYLTQEREENQPLPSFWNLHKYLTEKLEGFPHTALRIIHPSSPTINPLAYYRLLHPKLEELEKSKAPKPQSKDMQNNKITSLPCEIIDPSSLLMSLTRGKPAYLCLTSKYSLHRAQQECLQVEAMKKEAEEEDEKKEEEEESVVYLMSEVGVFEARELRVLDGEAMKVVVTHREELDEELDQILQMERYYRKFANVGMLGREKEYVQKQLHSRKTKPTFNVQQFYLAVNQANEDYSQDGLSVTSLTLANSSTSPSNLTTHPLQTSGHNFTIHLSESPTPLWTLQSQVLDLLNNKP